MPYLDKGAHRSLQERHSCMIGLLLPVYVKIQSDHNSLLNELRVFYIETLYDVFYVISTDI